MSAAEMRAQCVAARHPGLIMLASANVVAALDDERHQTQRRMIAALYWRAGATMVLAARAESRRQHAKCDRLCNAAAGAFSAAQAMEAACAR